MEYERHDTAASGVAAGRPVDDQTVSTSTCSKYDAKLHHNASQMANISSLDCSISSAASLAATSGIRSLPNALSNNSKQHIRDQQANSGIIQKVCVQLEEPSTSQPRRAHRSRSAGAALKPCASAVRPAKYSTLHGMFSVFERGINDEFDRAHMLDKFERLHSKALQVCPREFVVKGAHPSFRGTPVFSPFSYDSEPYTPSDAFVTCHGPSAVTTQHPSSATVSSCPAERAASPAAQSAAQAPFLPVKRGSSPELLLKANGHDMLKGLERHLATDWPGIFRHVHTERSTGAVVVAFHAEATGSSEADVSRYMNELARSNGTVAEFRLCKDAEHWGRMEGPCLLYRLWPPWVHYFTTAMIPGKLLSSLYDTHQMAWPCRDFGRGFAPQACLTVPHPRTMRF